MPSSRARSSADTALIDPTPTPKPRATRKTPAAPAVAEPAPEAPKAARKAPARKAIAPPVKAASAPPVVAVVVEQAAAATKVVTKKAVAKKVVAKKAAAKKVAVEGVAEVLAAEPVLARAPSEVPLKKPGKKTAAKSPAQKAAAKPVRARAAPRAAAAPVEHAAEAPVAEPVVDSAVPLVAVEVEAAVSPMVDEPVVEPAPAAPPLPAWSEVRLHADAWGQQLRWQAGEGCPGALQAQAQALLDADGGIDPLNDQGLLALHQAAGDAGHALRIDAAVWSAVAAGRDMRWRVHHLEQAYPEGTASAALQALWPAAAARLAPWQWEGALFAACAGRSLLADDAGLGHAPQALAAAALLARHFGMQRVLIVCPDARLPRWQRLLQPLSATSPVQHRLCGETAWAASEATLLAWAPELVIVDDTVAWQAGAAPAGVRALAPTYALVLMPEPAQRPQALADWLAWLDPQRVGVARQFQRRHRADDGQWRDLDRLRDTLAPVMLRRSRARWMQPVPGRRDRLVWVPMDADARAAHQAALPPLQAIVSRWRQAGYVSDQDQLRTSQALASLQQACSAAAPAKREALEALGDGGGPDAVCAELPWPLSAPRGAAPTVYLLTEGGLDEQRLWLRCIEPGADDWLCDPALFRQGEALVRRMEALGLLVDRWVLGEVDAVLQDAQQSSIL